MNIFDELKIYNEWRKATADMNPAMRLSYRNVKNAAKNIIELQQRTEALTKKDIGIWRAAWQQAINVDNPRRKNLLSIYTDVAVDLHVTGCVDQRKGYVLKNPFKVVFEDGSINEDATKLLHTEWFEQFCSLALDSIYYGHSLIQFGDVITGLNGLQTFDMLQLVPRTHVVPEFGVIIRGESDDWKQGIPYREGELSQWCIEVGDAHDLGLFLKCAPSALSKKNMIAFWDQFGEVFGMPIRIARTTSANEGERSKLMNLLDKMGSGFSAVFPQGTEIEIKESQKSDSYNVFDKRIDRANSEISKGILNQTMSIDSGSSLSQSEVHLEIFQNVIEKDKKMICNVVNNKLIPYMQNRGINIEGSFMYDDTKELTAQEQQQVEQMLLNSGHEIDPQYFIDKYGIPVTGKTSVNFFA